MHPEKVVSRGFRTGVRLPSGPPKQKKALRGFFVLADPRVEPPRANGANRGSHFASKAMGARSREPRAKIFAIAKLSFLLFCTRTVTEDFLRDVTLETIPNVEQKSRTTPLGDTKHGKSELFRYDGTVRICFLF